MTTNISVNICRMYRLLTQ